MRAHRIVFVLFGFLGIVQSLETTEYMVGKLIFSEESLTPMKIGGSEFVSQERSRNMQYRGRSQIESAESGCSDSGVECNRGWDFSEVKRFGIED